MPELITVLPVHLFMAGQDAAAAEGHSLPDVVLEAIRIVVRRQLYLTGKQSAPCPRCSGLAVASDEADQEIIEAGRLRCLECGTIFVPVEGDWIPALEAATRLGVSRHRVYQLCKVGTFNSMLVAGDRKVRRQDVERYAASR